ncbi:MAG: pseudouridine-5'-phosphate glycosidase, partial [Rhodospirillales bacterium]|nr:pseudouridine-5'-phosphate glycosidase [Rhodospirillales bacterium]
MGTQSLRAIVEVSKRVQTALAARTPVIALESTIIAHGLPWPDNIETAREMEAAI